MSLSSSELTKVLEILEQIDQGVIQPQFPGRIGRFLRQYSVAQTLVNQTLAERGIPRRADGSISGEYMAPIRVHPMRPPEVSLLHFPLGEVADTIALSEELGGFQNVTMWLKGPVANKAFNLLRTSGLQLSGSFRWFPTARLTPGEAELESSDEDVRWKTARCLKAVSDDIARPPHAAEYMLDYRMGPPGLKYFRSVCVFKSPTGLRILPGLAAAKELECSTVLPRASSVLKTTELAILLIYREPWSEDWTVVKAARIAPEDVVTHSTTWADFQKELDGSSLDAPLVAGISTAIRAAGLRPSTAGNPNLARSLLPLARSLIRAVRTSS